MDKLFGNKPSTKDQVRQMDRDLNKEVRTLDREKNTLEREERKLIAEIKNAAKAGDKATATILAKQLVNIRKQKTRMTVAGSNIKGVSMQAKSMGANVKMGEVMASTTKTMSKMNKVMDPQKTAQTMRQFEMESAKMDMTEEMMTDTLDDLLCASDEEEEQDAVVNQVLDEIGIEITGKMADAPSAMRGGLGESSRAGASTEDDDLMRRLEALK